MPSPIRISFHGLDHSDAAEVSIRERIERLEQRCDRITGGRVVVEARNNSHSHLNAANRPFHVTIHLTVPGDALTANHDVKRPKSYNDIESAIADAFRAIDRKLTQYVERKSPKRRRGKTDPVEPVDHNAA